MPALACRRCSSSNVEEDTSTGSLICTDCGAVCEENQIVSEVQFQVQCFIKYVNTTQVPSFPTLHKG